MKKQVKKKSKLIFKLLIGIIIFLLLSAYIIKYAIKSKAAVKEGETFYLIVKYKNGEVVNRYCYGNTGKCQKYDLSKKKPNNNKKKGITFYVYPHKVYLEKGSSCPPGDYIIKSEKDGSNLGCFGGHKETNLKIIGN